MLCLQRHRLSTDKAADAAGSQDLSGSLRKMWWQGKDYESRQRTHRVHLNNRGLANWSREAGNANSRIRYRCRASTDKSHPFGGDC
jgi:hypothetical protein